MANKKRRRQAPAAPSESQASVAATVAWMMSVVTTLLCASVAGLVWIVVRDRADNQSALVFVRLLHFSAIVTATVSLLLLPVISRIRREPPPTGLVVFAVIVAALPILAAILS